VGLFSDSAQAQVEIRTLRPCCFKGLGLVPCS